MNRISIVAKTAKFKCSIKAISPVIATLLMIAIAVVASLVVYAWVIGYIGGSTNKAGKAIAIPSFALDDSGKLHVYVQNVGQGTTQLSAVYVNNELKLSPDNVVPEGNTVELVIDGSYNANTNLNIKVTTTEGTFMTTLGKGKSGTTPTSTTSPVQYSINLALVTGADSAETAPSPGLYTYDAGSVVSIHTSALSGYHFTSWSSSTGSITFGDSYSISTTTTINGDGTITANFDTDAPSTVAITITSSTTGAGFVTVDGNTITTPQTFNWIPTSAHTIAATSTITAGTTRYQYTSWTDTGTQSHSYTVPNSAAKVTADYQKQYYLTVISVADSPIGQGWYNAGAIVSSAVTSPVTVTGPPLIVYTSTGWTGTGSTPTSGSITSTGNFAINAPSSVTWNWNCQMTLYPTGYAGSGSETITTSTSGAQNHWKDVSDSTAADNTAYSSVSSSSASYTDYYLIQDHGTAIGTITSVTAYIRGEYITQGSSTPSAQSYIRLGTSTSTGALWNLPSSWTTHSDALTRPGGGTWAWTDIDNLQSGVTLNRTIGSTVACTMVWVVISFTS